MDKRVWAWVLKVLRRVGVLTKAAEQAEAKAPAVRATRRKVGKDVSR